MIITSLKPQKRRRGRTSVFVDGHFVFGMDEADLARHKLSEGMEISKEQLSFLLKKVVCVKARDYALHYISTRPRTRFELEKKLSEEGYPQAVVNYVIKLMLQYRYIDDARYAKDYAVSRSRQGYGGFRIKMELKHKGIDEELIEAAMCITENNKTSSIKAWIIRKNFNPHEKDPKKRKRFIDAMIRRGFAYSAIKEAMDSDE